MKVNAKVYFPFAYGHWLSSLILILCTSLKLFFLTWMATITVGNNGHAV